MSEVKHKTWQELETEAAALGCVAVACGDGELILDLDGTESIHDNVLGNVKSQFGFYGSATIPSRGGKGSHVYIAIRRVNLSIIEKAAIQACLGSDPLKEFLTFTGVNKFNMLYETKSAHRLVLSWRHRTESQRNELEDEIAG